MNPLGLSVIFVLGSILLSFVKHIVFPSTQPINSVIKFNKVFQLTNNKIELPSKHYKSLYQAFHKSQLHDIQKFTNLLPNKEQFNQKILSNSLRNEQQSVRCGSDYLLLISSVISTDSFGYTSLLNTIIVYKIPLMTKIHEMKASLNLNLPLQCKRGPEMGSYNLVITNIEEIIWITIIDDKVSSKNKKQYKSSFKSLYRFDYEDGWIAYSNKEQPWIVQLKQFNQIQPSNNDESLQINLINLERQQNEGQNQYHSEMHLKIRDIFIVKENKSYEIDKKCFFITIVYQYYQNGDVIKKIKMSTFKFSQNNFTKIKNYVIDYGNYILNRVESQCSQYFNSKTTKFDISCLITRNGETQVKFVNFMDIFHQNYQINNLSQANFTQKRQEDLVNDYQSEELFENSDMDQGYSYDNQQSKTQNESDDDLLQMLGFLLPVGSESQKLPNQKQQEQKNIKVSLKFFSNGRLHLLKPSIPDPIIFYQQKGFYYLFSFNLLNEISSQQESIQIPSLNYRLERPTSIRIQEKQLRNIGWIQKQNLIVVLWGAGIEVYQYLSVEFQNNADGIAMSVIIPFIQLFATVFCLLRIVWTSE